MDFEFNVQEVCLPLSKQHNEVGGANSKQIRGLTELIKIQLCDD